MERQNLDTNLQLSGQQIVVLTAGTGYFEVCLYSKSCWQYIRTLHCPVVP